MAKHASQAPKKQPVHRQRSQPLTSFASPARRSTRDPALAERQKTFNEQYGNTHDERIQVLNPDPVWTLADVVGAAAAQAIEDSGQLSFHTVGDTGFDSFPYNQSSGQTQWDKPNTTFETALGALVQTMEEDTDPEHIDRGPAFLLQLGDVNYFNNTRSGYASQFYEPFSSYSRKIIAIPGNHDMEVRLGQQKFPCEAFIENFCQASPGVPPAARDITPPREMAAQPGLYWRLDTPFVQIIGLCTNIGETTGGVLRSKYAGYAQYDWFQSTLKEVAQDQKIRGPSSRRALIVALHHPPYTNGNHEPSLAMNKDLDDAFTNAKVWPDAVIAAHDHLYQRYTRTPPGLSIEIAYIVPGGGGRYHTQIPPRSGGSIPKPIPGVDAVMRNVGNGYLIVTARKGKLSFSYKPTDHFDKNVPETFQVNLKERRVL